MAYDQLNERQSAELGSSGNLAMTVNAVWRADYVFGPTYQWKEGTLGVAPMPQWSGGGTPLTGSEGGGQYVVSRHAKNMSGTMEVALYMAAGDYQKTAGTLPAYEPLRQEWMQTHVTANKLYADPNGVKEVFSKSVEMLNPDTKLTPYDPRKVWETAIAPGTQQGKTIESMINQLQSECVEAAKAAGLTVKES